MPLNIRCSGVWTGSGPPSGPTLLSIDRGRITGMYPLGDPVPGPFVIPAFVDAHCHFTWTGLQAVTLDLSGARSVGEMLDVLSREARSLAPGMLLRAENMEETSWEVPVTPTLGELDSAIGDRPAFVRRVCGHAVLVNSAMMAMLPDDCPELDRTTGMVKEGIALAIDRLFPPDGETLRRAIRAAERAALSEGITAACSMEPVFALQALGESPPAVELTAGVITDDPGELAELIGSGSARRFPPILGLKTFLDGSIGAGTAALSTPYADGAEVEPLLTDGELAERIVTASGMDLGLLVHAIGGRALGMIERVSTALARSDPGSLTGGIRVEHAEELSDELPGRWDPALHSFCMQPNFVDRWQREGGLYSSMLGTKAAVSLNPFSSVLRSGLRMGFGSDGMPLGPLSGLAGATDHPDPAQRLDTAAALHAYTLGAAHICGFHELSVPLREGRAADLVFLSESPFTAAGWDALDILATMRNGDVLFGNEEMLCADPRK